MFEFVSCFFTVKDKFEVERGYLRKDTLFYIIKGEIKYSIDGKADTASSGDLVHFPAAVYFERTITKPLKFYHICFKNPQNIKLPNGKIEFNDTAMLLSNLDYIHRRIPDNNIQLKNYFLNDIFIRLEAYNTSTAVYEDEIITKTTKYLTENLNKKITLEDIAQQAALSISGLIYHFKTVLGTTPIAYLINLRLKNAETLLCYTDLSVSEISSKCGFDTPYYFSNVFKKYNGMSPSTFRQSFRI